MSGADAYEIETDDSCDAAFTCQFPSPELHQRVAETSFRPEQALPVSTVAPVGRRYFWRVRACDGNVCSRWSPVRYVDVGRQRQDFNGDGFGDLVVTGESDIWVYLGGDALDATADWSKTLSGEPQAIPADVAWVGDMNGDGFSDLAIVACSPAVTCTVQIVAGGAGAEHASVAQIALDTDGAQPSLRPAGDLDADGHADVAAVWSGADVATRSTVAIFGGRSIESPRTWLISATPINDVIGGCDLNGDGADDLVGVGTSQVFLAPGGSRVMSDAGGFQPFGTAAGYVALACAGDVDGSGLAAAVLGKATHDPQDPAPLLRILQPDGLCDEREMSNPVGGFASRPTVSGRMDLNGDGVHDLVLGDPGSSRALFALGGTCPPDRFSTFEHGASGLGRSNTGSAVSSPGDMDGDGFDEAAVANPVTGVDSVVRGEVYVLRGGADGPTALDLTIAGDGRFGFGID